MGLIGTGEELVKASSGYQFGITTIDDLGASEYTLVGIACDVSASVGGFDREMETCLKEIINACKKSPRSENLMMRTLHFNQNLTEQHGFKLLSAINENDIDNSLRPSGMTALYDAIYHMTESVADYGKLLTDQDFDANGIVFVITDGEDNRSRFTPQNIKQLREKIMKDESLESLLVILIGVGMEDRYLQMLKDEGELDQFINIANADAKTLAKVAEFVSQSISSQSQALGSGGPSVTLDF